MATSRHDLNRQTDRLKSIILDNLNIEASEIVDWVAGQFSPTDVFPENELEDWATDNGYIKPKEEIV